MNGDSINKPVLVLNQDYRPINICRARRAIVMALAGKAEVMENGQGEVHSVSHTVPLPSVIRLVYYIRRPPVQKKLTRLEVFSRDGFTCQYCGKEAKELTLDHVVPRYRGGEHTWENVVSCCIPCNRRKAGRTPSEADMKLSRQPFSPRPAGFSIPHQYLRSHSEWRKFLGVAS